MGEIIETDLITGKTKKIPPETDVWDASKERSFVISETPISLAEVDFQGAAKLFVASRDQAKVAALSRKGGGAVALSKGMDFLEGIGSFVDIDLVITGVSVSFADRHQIENLNSDFFTTCFKGRSPIVLSVRATLFDLPGNLGKYSMMMLYKDLFRLSKVARHGIPLCMEFLQTFAQGAFLDLNLSESGAVQDTIFVSFSFLVFNLSYVNYNNMGRFNRVDIIFSEKSNLLA